MHFTSLRMCKTRFHQTLPTLLGVAYTPNRTKTNHHKVIINQSSPPRSGRSEGKLTTPWATLGLHQRSILTSFNNTWNTKSNSSARQVGQTSVTNSQAAIHKSWLVRCSPRAPRFSRDNLQAI